MSVSSVPRAAKLPMKMLYIYAGCRAMESSLQNGVSIFSVNSEELEVFRKNISVIVLLVPALLEQHF